MDVSIIISDGVLSFTAFYTSYMLYRYNGKYSKIAAIGILIIGLTSFTGFINHFGIKETAPFGVFFGNLSNFMGVPLIGLAFLLLIFNNKNLSFLFILLVVLLYIVFSYLYVNPLLPTILGGISMLVIISVSLAKMKQNTAFSILGITGALLILTAGLVIGTEGKIGSILRLDLFHYTIAGAILCFYQSLVKVIDENHKLTK
jgi:glucitol/sorbitol PTS system EIIB component